MAQMLLREPALLVIWTILLVLTGPALVVLATPEGVRRPGKALRQAAGTLRGYRRRPDRREHPAPETVRYAEELAAAADNAATAAQRWHERWQQAQQRLDIAWQAWHDADARMARSRAAAAFAPSRAATAPAEYADRERFLSRMVLAAARRGELPITAAADALAGRGGWDPALHPAEQERRVHRAAAAYLAQRYRTAAAAESSIWHDAQLAAATRDSLRAELSAVTAAATLRYPLPRVTAPHRATAKQAIVVRAA